MEFNPAKSAIEGTGKVALGALTMTTEGMRKMVMGNIGDIMKWTGKSLLSVLTGAVTLPLKVVGHSKWIPATA